MQEAKWAKPQRGETSGPAMQHETVHFEVIDTRARLHCENALRHTRARTSLRRDNCKCCSGGSGGTEKQCDDRRRFRSPARVTTWQLTGTLVTDSLLLLCNHCQVGEGQQRRDMCTGPTWKAVLQAMVARCGHQTASSTMCPGSSGYEIPKG